MLLQLIHTLSQLIWRLPILSNIKEAFVDFKDLSLNRRILVLGGYMLLAGMLFFLMLAELLGRNWSQITFSSNEDLVEVPFVVMVISSLGFAIGWSYILTGATDFKRRAFWLIFGLYTVQLFVLIPVSQGALIWLCAAPLVLLGTIGIHSYGRGKAFIAEWPVTEFLIWVVINFFFLGLFWFFSETDTEVAGSLNANFSILFLLTITFWVTSGLAVARAAVGVGRGVVMVLRRLFPEQFLRVMALAFILVRPLMSIAAAAILFQSDNKALNYMAVLDMLLSIPITLWMLLLIFLRRWHLEQALTLLGLTVGLPVFSLGIGLAFIGQDMTDFLALSLESVGFFPPVLLFSALLIHELLTAGIPFATRNSDTLPKSGRLFLVFGAALLMISFTLFQVSARDVVTSQPHNDLQLFVNNLFSISALFLGIPYLIWIVWRRREEVIGDELEVVGVNPLFARLDQIHWGVWLAVGLVVMFGGSILFCVATIFLIPH